MTKVIQGKAAAHKTMPVAMAKIKFKPNPSKGILKTRLINAPMPNPTIWNIIEKISNTINLLVIIFFSK